MTYRPTTSDQQLHDEGLGELHNRVRAGRVAKLVASSPRTAVTVGLVLRRRLTYLSSAALVDLAQTVRDLERRDIPGVVVETGTALGGSAIVIAAAKTRTRVLRCFDMFGMIPPPSTRDGRDVICRYQTILEGKSEGLKGDEYYGYRDDLRDGVEASFAAARLPIERNRVELIQGDFRETLTCAEPVALAHLDGDWYESTRVCLDRLAPRIVAGGRFVVDDYADWSGCRTAVHEFLATDPGFVIERRERVHLVRR